MADDIVKQLIDKVDQVLIKLAILETKKEAQDDLKHEERIKTLENIVTQWTGNKILIGWLITTAIAVFAAMKH